MEDKRNTQKTARRYASVRRPASPEGSLTSTGYLRTVNVISVLRALYKEGSCSRTDLARITGISLPTITRIFFELVRKKFVVAVGREESSGGRRPELFQLNYDQLFIVGIYLRSAKAILAVANLNGKVISRRELVPISLIPEHLLDELLKEIWLLLKGDRINRGHIIGIGLAVAGVVDNQAGVILHSANLSWNDVAIGRILEEKTGIPVVIENDANAAAMAELWFGCAKNASSLIYIKTDTGVGAGVISDRRLITGPYGLAGEIGYLPVLQGVLDDYLHLPIVFRRFEESTGERLTDAQHFSSLIAENHPVAKQLCNEAAEALARTIVFAGSLLGMEMAVIGGFWGSFHHGFLREVADRCRPHWERNNWRRPPAIVGSELGEESDLRGAVGLVVHRWFEAPV